MAGLEHTAASLDIDTAVAFADDPDVELVPAAVDHVAPEHGQNPELIDEGAER